MHGDQKKDTIHGFQILPSLWGHFVQTWKYHNLECLNLSKQPNLIAKLWPMKNVSYNKLLFTARVCKKNYIIKYPQ